MSEKINGWNIAALSAKAKSAGGKNPCHPCDLCDTTLLFRGSRRGLLNLERAPAHLNLERAATPHFHQQLCCALSGRNANVCTDKFANLRRLEV